MLYKVPKKYRASIRTSIMDTDVAVSLVYEERQKRDKLNTEVSSNQGKSREGRVNYFV